LEYFVENTFNYPTLVEAYKIATLDAWEGNRTKTVTLFCSVIAFRFSEYACRLEYK